MKTIKALRGCGFLPWLVAAAALLFLQPGMSSAASDPGKVSVSINAGETYTISNVNPASTPGVRVIKNPHALIVHNEEPGKLVLLGADAGEWAIDVQNTDGTVVSYDVAVKVLPNPITGEVPASTAAAAPAPKKLDAGAGPVKKADDKTITVASSSTSTAGKSGEPVEVSSWTPPSSGSAASDPSTTVVPDSTPHSSHPASAPSPATEVAAAPSTSNQSSLLSNQAAATSLPSGGRYREDPTLTSTGENYETDAVNGGTHYLPDDVVSLMTSTSEVIDFPDRIRRVSIADTAVADIQVVNPFQINLIGHKPGYTTLAVWNSQGQYVERQVRIEPVGKQQVMLNCIVAELDRQRTENQGINLSLAFPNQNVSLVGLPGTVATPYNPATNTGGGGQVNNSLPPQGSLIPLILSSGLTYGLAAGNSNILNQSFFQYLEAHQLAKILAQPHLLANSGEPAKFLSGGEIPIVISQALNTSIVFKQFGTSVMFLPTVVGKNDIQLLVAPEVSEPDFAHGVQEFGFNVPAFVTRRAQTMVRLRDDQTLIIAGLIEHKKTSTVNKVPYLGDMPYLGALFRTTGYSNNESDLVMSVTPQIVRPLPAGAETYNPYDTPEMTTEQIRTRSLAEPNVARPRF